MNACVFVLLITESRGYRRELMSMRLSVACNFESEPAARLAAFPEVREVYGRLTKDAAGTTAGVDSVFAGDADLRCAVRDAHDHGLFFCYVLEGDEVESSIPLASDSRALRRVLDYITDLGIDRVSLSSLSLLSFVKSNYPELSVHAGLGARIDDPHTAYLWADMGADSLCLSATACNRDFARLAAIREAVACDLQLTVDMACPPSSVYGAVYSDGFAPHGENIEAHECSAGRCRKWYAERLRYPVNFIRAVWIRPEDLCFYEDIGYTHFRISIVNSPTELLLQRVEAYAKRRFEGNLLDIVGPANRAAGYEEPGPLQRLPMARALFRIAQAKTGPEYVATDNSDAALADNSEHEQASAYIDNAGLRGFLKGMPGHNCVRGRCGRCGYCHRWAAETVEIENTSQDHAFAHTDPSPGERGEGVPVPEIQATVQ
ncbi:MAG: hypothetical protein GF344_16795 [Chitinivibrionales bacterium]|nr:hypothetical protein [Chitinivibrionales bacterium]MBD3358348.1 hypothetical protein [Chitinivibrionales bacterium]